MWTLVVFVGVVIEHDIANQMSQFFPSSENHTFWQMLHPFK
jgi:hypothetical protein